MTLNRVWRRVLNAVAPAAITTTNDAGPVLSAQIQIGYMEIIDNVPVLQQFGLASVPPPGSDAAAAFVAGDRSNGVVVATNDQTTRPTGKQSGETMLYNARGMQVYLSASGIVINTGGAPVTINGDLHVTGEVVRGFGTADQVTLGQHRHGTGSAAAGTVAPTPGT
jgi:phage gp45-like